MKLITLVGDGADELATGQAGVKGPKNENPPPDFQWNVIWDPWTPAPQTGSFA